MSQPLSPDEETLAEMLSDAVNCGGVNSDELTDAIAGEHPHLQNQIFMEVIKPMIIDYAQRDYVDARNKRAVEECREIVEQMDWYVEK